MALRNQDEILDKWGKEKKPWMWAAHELLSVASLIEKQFDQPFDFDLSEGIQGFYLSLLSLLFDAPMVHIDSFLLPWRATNVLREEFEIIAPVIQLKQLEQTYGSKRLTSQVDGEVINCHLEEKLQSTGQDRQIRNRRLLKIQKVVILPFTCDTCERREDNIHDMHYYYDDEYGDYLPETEYVGIWLDEPYDSDSDSGQLRRMLLEPEGRRFVRDVLEDIWGKADHAAGFYRNLPYWEPNSGIKLPGGLELDYQLPLSITKEPFFSESLGELRQVVISSYRVYESPIFKFLKNSHPHLFLDETLTKVGRRFKYYTGILSPGEAFIWFLIREGDVEKSRYRYFFTSDSLVELVTESSVIAEGNADEPERMVRDINELLVHEMGDLDDAMAYLSLSGNLCLHINRSDPRFQNMFPDNEFTSKLLVLNKITHLSVVPLFWGKGSPSIWMLILSSHAPNIREGFEMAQMALLSRWSIGDALVSEVLFKERLATEQAKNWVHIASGTSHSFGNYCETINVYLDKLITCVKERGLGDSEVLEKVHFARRVNLYGLYYSRFLAEFANLARGKPRELSFSHDWVKGLIVQTFSEAKECDIATRDPVPGSYRDQRMKEFSVELDGRRYTGEHVPEESPQDDFRVKWIRPVMRFLIHELSRNAFKHSADSSLEVMVNIKSRDASESSRELGNSILVLKVINNFEGEKFPAEGERQSWFSPLTGSSADKGGKGLGLFLIKTFLEDYCGGSIVATDEFEREMKVCLEVEIPVHVEEFRNGS